MCGIIGIRSKNGMNVLPLTKQMFSTMEKRGPDGVGLFMDNKIIYAESLDKLNIYSIKCDDLIGHSRLAITGGYNGAQPFLSCDKKLIVEHNGEIYNYLELRSKLSQTHNFKTNTDSEVILHLLEEQYQKSNENILQAIKNTVSLLDGIYILVIREQSTGDVILVRDKLGVRQIYYAENNNFIVFASEKKALWQINVFDNIKRILPGHALIISNKVKDQFFETKLIPVNLDFSELSSESYPILYNDMESAINAYEKKILLSIKKRVYNIRNLGIIFSGGIDSVLISYLSKKYCSNITCYTAGVKGSSDITNSIQITDELGLKLKVKEFNEEEIEKLLPKIIKIIEDNNMGQVEVAIPIYGAVQNAHEDGIRVMLTGQGADEIFGGYSWYSKIVDKYGHKKIMDYMIQDLKLLYKETLEREDKITMAHSIELREPFLDTDLIETVLKINPKLNIFNGKSGTIDRFGKRVHRNFAMKIGIPKSIAFRVKEAAQHGSGIHETLVSIAKKNGYDEKSVTKEYLDKLRNRERVGSSQRYGHLFETENIWTIEPYVQMYLDDLSKNILH